MNARETVLGWLSDPDWPKFGPGIGSGPLDPGRMAARAAAEQVLEQFAAPAKIGVLCHDNGEYDAYVAYFDDPDKLRAAVERLNAERWDTEAMEPAAAEVAVVTIKVVPAIIDDDYLDHLAGLLEDAGVYIESAADARKRREEEAAENAADEIPFIPSPGQEEIGL